MGEPIIETPGVNQVYQTEAALLTSRWESTGLLSGIEDPHVRACTAVLLENQRIIRECTTDQDQHKAFWNMSIKMVAKVFPQLLINKIGSV